MAFLYELDILNRNPTYSLIKTTDNSFIIWTLRDAGNSIVARSKGLDDDEVILINIRSSLGIEHTVRACITETQRDSVTVPLGTDILNTTSDSIETYNGSTWVSVGSINGSFTELFEDAGTRSIAGWGVIATPTSHINKLLTVVIHNDATGLKDVGARSSGSSLERKFFLAKDSALSLVVLTDSSGNFEICSDSSTDVAFTIVGVV